MEETDGIIIESLRRIGCDIEENVTCLEHFTTEIIIEGVVKCISSIKPDIHLNHRLPPNLPAQYKLCIDIARACKDIGIKYDLGYETFLHGSQAEIRRVFIILIHMLPRANEQPIVEEIDSLQNVLSEIQKEIQMQLSRPWIPFFCHGHKEKCDPFHSIDISHRMYQSGNEALTKLSSVPAGTLIPSLIEKHSSDLASEKYSFKFPAGSTRKENEPDIESDNLSTKFNLMQLFHHMDLTSNRKMNPLPPPKPTHLSGFQKTEATVPTKEEHFLKLSLELANLQLELKSVHKEFTIILEEVSEMKQTIERKAIAVENDRKVLERKEKLNSLLPEASAHLKRIQVLLESNKEKMVLLKNEWTEIKQPLEDEHQRILQKHNNNGNEQLKLSVEQTAQCLRQVVEEIHSKEELIARLENRLEALPSTALTRSFYTQRILSIVANVKKQNEEMQRVIDDVKSIQRENNSLIGKVGRTFTVTDEIIFRMAQTDEKARRIYKYLMSLHSDCSEILKLVEEAGTLSREIKTIDEQKETESRKNIRFKLKQMQSDLEQIGSENQNMERALTVNS